MRGVVQCVALGVLSCSLTRSLDDLEGAATGGVGGVAGASGGTAGAAGGGGQAGGGGADAGPSLAFTDDELEGEFGAGTMEDVEWAGGHLQLAPGKTTGRFVSRVFDAQTSVSWTSLAWTPGAPYGKALPAGAATETGYAAGSMDMLDNVLLWPFDGAAPTLMDGTVVSDASGAGSDLHVVGDEQTLPGFVGSFLRDSLSAYVMTPIGAASSLNLGTSEFTWSLWVKTNQDCPDTGSSSGNRVYLGAEDTSDQTHLWFGCSSTLSACSDNDGTGRAGGVVCSRKTPTNDCRTFCGKSVINDGKWHHLAVVKRGHNPGTLRLFVDGAPDSPSGDVDTAFDVPIAFDPDTELTAGAFSLGSYPAAGDFDEVAIWRRALSDAEVARIYERGATRLSLRVRTCSSADCTDAAPFGDPAFSDDVPLMPPTGRTLDLTPARFVQYEVVFETQAGGPSPKLLAVSVQTEP